MITSEIGITTAQIDICEDEKKEPRNEGQALKYMTHHRAGPNIKYNAVDSQRHHGFSIDAQS